MFSVPYWLVCIFNFHNENLCTRKRKKESKPDTLTDERLYLMLAKMPTECLYVQNGARMIILGELHSFWFVVQFQSNILW